MMTKRKMYFHMLFASLMRRKSRMLIALLAIAIGATILSGLVTIYYEVPKQMGAEFRNYGANMILTPSDASFTNDELNDAISVFDSDDLVGATPYRYQAVRIHEQPIQAAGTDMESVQKTSPYWLVDGDWPDEAHEILVGETVADDLNLKIGDKLPVYFTPEDLTQLDNCIDFTITGILNTGGSEEEYVYISMEDMEELTEISDVITIAELSVSADSEGLNQYVETINNNSDTLSAKLVKRVTASETTVLSKLQALILLVTIVVLALTMICVATTMTAVVSERRSEIGLRKAIGASDKSLIEEFMGEGVMLGFFGGILGTIIGFLFAEAVSVNVFGSYISFRPWIIPVTIIASMVISGVACLIPIKSAVKIEPALVLKGE